MDARPRYAGRSILGIKISKYVNRNLRKRYAVAFDDIDT